MALAALGLAPVVLTEAIMGWRAWALVGSARGKRVRLASISRRFDDWTPRDPARARCGFRPAHDVVPAPDCRCGLHATRDPGPLRRARDPAVLGTVALWGRVIEHERGYRAQLAYPQRLGLVCQLCLWWRGASKESPRPCTCEVVVLHRGGRMVPFCRPHLELARRHGYPSRRLLDAAEIESALLAAYAVDPLPVA